MLFSKYTTYDEAKTRQNQPVTTLYERHEISSFFCIYAKTKTQTYTVQSLFLKPTCQGPVLVGNPEDRFSHDAANVDFWQKLSFEIRIKILRVFEIYLRKLQFSGKQKRQLNCYIITGLGIIL